MFKFLKTALFLSLSLLLFLAITPFVLSSEWGKTRCIQLADYLSNGKTKIETLECGWLTSQKIENISWQANSKSSSFSCKEIKTDAPLWKILFQRDTGNLVISEPLLSINPAVTKKTKPSRPHFPNEAPDHTAPKISMKTPFFQTGNVIIEHGWARIKNLEISSLYLKLLAQEKEDILVDLSFETVEPDFVGKCNVVGSFQNYKNFRCKTKLINFPMHLFQEELLGKTVSGDVEIQSTSQNIEMSIDASSSQFALFAQVITNDGIISLQAPALVTWKSPSDTSITLKVNELKLPLDPTKEASFNLSFYSPLASFENALFVKNENFSLAAPLYLFGQIKGNIDTLIIPSNWQDLQMEGQINFTPPFLEETVTAQARIQSLKNVSLDLQGKDFHTTLEGELDVSHKLFCSNKKAVIDYKFSHYPLHIELDSLILPLSKEMISSSYVKGLITTEDLTIESFTFKKTMLAFEAKGKDQKAELLLTSDVDNGSCKVEASLSSIFEKPLDHATIRLKINTDRVKANLFLKKEKDILTLLNPGKAEYLCASLDLIKLTLPLSNPLLFEAQGDLLVNNFSFQNETLNHLRLHLEKPSSQTPLSFQLNGTTSANGVIVSNGSWDALSKNLTANVSLQNIPSSLLNMRSTLGPSFSCAFSTKLQNFEGDVHLKLTSLNSHLSLKGKIEKGALLLSENLYAQITPSSELMRIYSHFPCIFEIAKEGFRLPLYPFDISQIQAPHIHLELGQVIFPQQEDVGLLLSLLRLSTSNREKEIPIWFSPIDIQIKSGIVHIDRVDALIDNSYQVCTWGSFNLLKDKLKMNLGFTSSALRKAFNLQNLPDDYVLQIPLKGGLDHVRIDKTKATAKIAEFLLLQESPLGSWGKFLSLGINAPPAKHPLPWESEKPNKTEELKKKSKKEFRPEDKPLKQILKMLSP